MKGAVIYAVHRIGQNLIIYFLARTERTAISTDSLVGYVRPITEAHTEFTAERESL